MADDDEGTPGAFGLAVPEPDSASRSDTGTRATPGDTMPPPVEGETPLDAITAAIAWEYRRRSAGGVRASPMEHAHAYAHMALRTLEQRFALPEGSIIGWRRAMADFDELDDGEGDPMP